MFTFLRALGLEPVEWEQAVRETGKGAPYNREVVERLFVGTQAVIILLTGDEDVTLRTPFCQSAGEDRMRRQARGNVLFEAGMAFGLHPDRTIIVEIGQQDVPSDLVGLNAVRFDGSPEMRDKLKGRLVGARCEVKAAGDDWLRLGKEQFERALAL
jgi:predicted nucleotide-binding protein